MISAFIIIFLLSIYERGMIMALDCPEQLCSYDDPIAVRFPFRILNESLPSSCGYPGFDLLCDASDRLSVKLPDSGVFSVQTVDYVKQQLWLNDPDNCLPRRLLSLNHHPNHSANYYSPFVAAQERDYWLYNCSSDYLKSMNIVKQIIGCLSSPAYGVVATFAEMTHTDSTSHKCRNIGSIRVPVGSSKSNEMDYSDLTRDIRVTWAEPVCGECFHKGGSCGFKGNSSLEVECYNVPHHGVSGNAVVAIALAFTAPLVLLVVCIVYFMTRAICHRRRRRFPQGREAATLTPEMAQIHVPNGGLDDSTIESYPKVVLGESRRLPKPDDKHCPICLGEYLPKDTLRTLLQCSHSFHAECVDEWLRLQASCPVCRTYASNFSENM